jgi:hypothetical protein
MCPDQSERAFPFAGFHGCCTEKISFERLEFSSSLEVHKAVEHFLNAINDRHLLLLGDSLTLQIFKAFLMLFKSNGIAMIHQDGRPFGATNYVSIIPANATMRLIEFYRVSSVDSTGVDHKQLDRDPKRMILAEDVLRAALGESDTVIANIGLHYATNSGYQFRMMSKLQKIIMEEADRRKFCFLWRSTTPQHFPGSNGTGTYNGTDYSKTKTKDCAAVTSKWTHPSDAVLERVRVGSKIPLIDITSLLEGAHTFHSLKVGDCSHFCYSPDLFAPMLTLFGEAIRQSC